MNCSICSPQRHRDTKFPKFLVPLCLCGSKTLCFFLILAIGCTGVLAAAPGFSPARSEWGGELLRPNQGCTTVYATDGRQMLGGNNEDYFDPLTKVWFVPAEAGIFGRVYFGYENYFPQGGMNDQGLFFDGLAVDTALPVLLDGKQQFTATIFLDYVMARCATVACVVEMFETYYAEETWAWQHLFGDATGESAIVEPQTILRQRGGFQVATNFYQSTTPPEERTCWRYQAATKMLEGSPALSVGYIRDVMDAAHVEGEASTLYTNVYDLVNRKVYLYYFFDYEHVVVLDLAEELAKGAHAYDLPALFPPNPAAEEFAAPILRSYHNLILSRLAAVDPAFLAAYVGDYELPEGWGAPGERIQMVEHGVSLMMVFPDAHRYELFPQGATSFFAVTWGNTDFEVRFDANFGVDADGRVRYLQLDYGGGGVRINRLGAASYVPYVPTPVPTATRRPTVTPSPTSTPKPSATPSPTATAEPTPAPTAMPAAAAPESRPGFPWGWVVVPAALLAVAGGLVFLRRRLPRR
jgi:hypothetical protein